MCKGSLRAGFQFPVPSSSPGHRSPLLTKPDVLGGSSSQSRFPSGTGNPLILREDLLRLRQPLRLECLWARSVGPEETLSAPPAYFGVVFFFNIFSCRRATLLVFRSFSKVALLCVAVSFVVFMRVGELASSYLVILIPPPTLI